MNKSRKKSFNQTKMKFGWGSLGPPNRLGGPWGPQIYKKYAFLIKKITNNIKKIESKNSEKKLKIFENAQKVNFSGHCQGGYLKNFFKKF